MTGTDLKVITPAASDVLGPDVDRLATLHTNAKIPFLLRLSSSATPARFGNRSEIQSLPDAARCCNCARENGPKLLPFRA